MAPISGLGNDFQNGNRILCFLEGLAWYFDAGNDNLQLQPQTFEFCLEHFIGKACLASCNSKDISGILLRGPKTVLCTMLAQPF